MTLGHLLATTAMTAGCAVAQPVRSNSGTSRAAVSQPSPQPTAPPRPKTGRLVIVQNGNLANFDLQTLQGRPATSFPRGGVRVVASAFARSGASCFHVFCRPDQSERPQSERPVPGGLGRQQPGAVAPQPGTGATFDDPCWTADDQAILATLRQPIFEVGIFAGESVAIVRVSVSGGKGTVLVTGAMGPGVSPDGRYLAYSGVDAQGAPSGFYVGDPERKSATRILDNQGFGVMRFPSFASDSSRIVFAAIGGPTTTARTSSGWLPPGFDVADADGPPGDLVGSTGWQRRPTADPRLGRYTRADLVAKRTVARFRWFLRALLGGRAGTSIDADLACRQRRRSGLAALASSAGIILVLPHPILDHRLLSHRSRGL